MAVSSEFLRLPAPAKLNLMLRIVGRREDGYHLLQTVFQFIDHCDWITFRLRSDGEIKLLTPLPGVAEENDLTVRAALALQQQAKTRVGAEIEVEKNIPMGGGLGGGSSDAATTLLGLNALWQTGLSLSDLKELGIRLGADVPVFIAGQSAWAEGIGELLTPIDLPEPWYVILVPGCSVSTGKIFSASNLTRDNKSIKIADFLRGQQENHCLPVVLECYPEIGEAMVELSRYSPAKLTGTGACIFAAFDSEHQARSIAAELKLRWSVIVSRGMNRSFLHQALGLSH
jgi:4-diphosphocytidyl-2-C-methyl-D-erythritol kinase